VGEDTVRAAVPPSVLAGLRQAFADEVAERLPRLVALDDLEQARRDAHTLASGAWVVGEPEIARVARAVEAQLPGGPVGELVALLEAWTL
jgi:HPt (histidine-containing phosphotransfer) domain-containing protein